MLVSRRGRELKDGAPRVDAPKPPTPDMNLPHSLVPFWVFFSLVVSDLHRIHGILAHYFLKTIHAFSKCCVKIDCFSSKWDEYGGIFLSKGGN